MKPHETGQEVMRSLARGEVLWNLQEAVACREMVIR